MKRQESGFICWDVLLGITLLLVLLGVITFLRGHLYQSYTRVQEREQALFQATSALDRMHAYVQTHTGYPDGRVQDIQRVIHGYPVRVLSIPLAEGGEKRSQVFLEVIVWPVSDGNPTKNNVDCAR